MHQPQSVLFLIDRRNCALVSLVATRIKNFHLQNLIESLYGPIWYLCSLLVGFGIRSMDFTSDSQSLRWPRNQQSETFNIDGHRWCQVATCKYRCQDKFLLPKLCLHHNVNISVIKKQWDNTKYCRAEIRNVANHSCWSFSTYEWPHLKDHHRTRVIIDTHCKVREGPCHLWQTNMIQSTTELLCHTPTVITQKWTNREGNALPRWHSRT